MKKFFLVVMLVIAFSTNAFALDGLLSGEIQAYTNNGYRNFEGNVEVGQKIPYFVRPFVAIQYFADNAGVNSTFQHLNAIYKAGVSRNLGPVTLSGGFVYNQNLQSNTSDNKGYFAKATLAFGQ
jgi:hypothetical protein